MLTRAIIVLVASNILKTNYRTAVALGSAMGYKSIDFEVFGKVQGVFFRKYTKEQADRLGIRGWCRNTAQGTVQGQLQGSEDRVETMINWLKSEGSPASEIEKAEFRNHEDIANLTYDDFTIRRD